MRGAFAFAAERGRTQENASGRQITSARAAKDFEGGYVFVIVWSLENNRNKTSLTTVASLWPIIFGI